MNKKRFMQIGLIVLAVMIAVTALVACSSKECPHAWGDYVVTKAANCSETGTRVKTCKLCNATQEETISVNQDHDWGAWTVVTPATTEAEGLQERVCNRNHSHVDRQTINKLQPGADHTHSFTEQNTDAKYLASAATCTAKAKYYYSCSCGDKDLTRTFESGNMLSHSFTAEKADADYLVSAATCTAKAKYNYSCAVCGAKDATRTFEYGEPTAHAFTAKTAEANYLKSAATCTAKAQYYYSCAACGMADTTRSFESGETELHNYTQAKAEARFLASQATCTAKATYYYSCAVCGAKDVNRTFESGETVAHTFTEKNDDAKYIASTATCTAKATYYYSCAVCHEKDTTKTFESGETESHNYTAQTIDAKYLAGNATCKEKAKYYYSCSACGAKNEARTFETGELADHTWNVDAATCTVAKVCTVCQTLGQAPIEHNYVYSEEKSTAATCGVKGVEVKVCSMCKAETRKDIDALTHSWGNWTVSTPATCTTKGSETRSCSNCLGVDSREIAAYNHIDPQTEKSAVSAATCTEAAVCSLCDAVISPKLGHQYQLNEEECVEATCGTAGKNVYKCARCQHSYEDTINATGEHNVPVESWEKVGAPVLVSGCEYKTTYSGECSVCHQSIEKEETSEIHKYTIVTIKKAATCVEEGTKTFKCSVCEKATYDASYSDEDAHDWEAGVPVDGVTTYTCQNGCGKTKTTVDHRDKTEATVDSTVLKGAGAIELKEASITFNDDAKDVLSGDVVISATADTAAERSINNEKVPADAKVYDITMTSDGSGVSELGGTVTVCVPYELKEGEDPESVFIYYINDKDELEIITARYSNGFAYFETTHFSYYTVTRLTPAERCAFYKKHTWSLENTVQPNCTVDGYKYYVCQRCGETKIEVPEALQAKGHNMKDTVTPATCTADGYTTHACTVCGYSYKDALTSATGHNYAKNAVKSNAATCTKTGADVYTCTACGDEYSIVLPMIDHSFGTEVVSPLCTTAGYTLHTCAACGYSYKDTETAAVGHNYAKNAAKSTPATCAATGATYYTCSACGDEYAIVEAMTSHEYQETIVPATCTAGGYTLHKCANCNAAYTDTEVAATGHNYAIDETKSTPATCTKSGMTTHTCSECGDSYYEVVAMIPHSFDSNVVAPTCTAGGYTLHECANCGYSYKDTETEAKGHTYAKNAAKSTAATCTKTGVTYYTCSVCGDEYYDVVAQLPHDYKDTVVAPTCTEAGYTLHACKNCNASYKDTETSALGHDYKAVITDATCTEEGFTTYTCSRCKATYKTDVVAAKGHTWDIEAPTCGKGQTCVICGVKGLSATGDHKYENGICTVCGSGCEHTFTKATTAPTCTEVGYTVYTCSKCGFIETKDYVKATGHSYKATVKAPTCTEKGYTLHKCSNCDASYKDSETLALGHDFVKNAAKSTPATCTKEGTTVYACSRCKAEKSETAAKIPHELKDTVAAPTCTEDGYTLHECENCDYSVKDTIIKSEGHNIVKNTKKSVAATCTKEGVNWYICSVCGGAETSERVAKLAHELKDTVVAPTCTAGGYTLHECKNCDYSFKDTIVGAKGHTWDIAAPTCVQGQTCVVCGANGLPATGEHTYVNGVCSVCGKKETKESSYTLTVLNNLFTQPLYIHIDELRGIVGSLGQYVSSEEEDSIVYCVYENISGIKDVELYIHRNEKGTFDGKVSGYILYSSANYYLSGNTNYDSSCIAFTGTMTDSVLDILVNEGGTEYVYRFTFAQVVDLAVGELADIAFDIEVEHVYEALSTIITKVNSATSSLSEVLTDEQMQMIYEAIDALFDKVFVKVEADGVTEIALDFNKLADAVEYLLTKKVDEVVDDVFGEGTFEAWKTSALSLFDKTMGELISALEEQGIDIDEVIDELFARYRDIQNKYNNAENLTEEELEGDILFEIICMMNYDKLFRDDSLLNAARDFLSKRYNVSGDTLQAYLHSLVKNGTFRATTLSELLVEIGALDQTGVAKVKEYIGETFDEIKSVTLVEMTYYMADSYLFGGHSKEVYPTDEYYEGYPEKEYEGYPEKEYEEYPEKEYEVYPEKEYEEYPEKEYREDDPEALDNALVGFSAAETSNGDYEPTVLSGLGKTIVDTIRSLAKSVSVKLFVDADGKVLSGSVTVDLKVMDGTIAGSVELLSEYELAGEYDGIKEKGDVLDRWDDMLNDLLEGAKAEDAGYEATPVYDEDGALVGVNIHTTRIAVNESYTDKETGKEIIVSATKYNETFYLEKGATEQMYIRSACGGDLDIYNYIRYYGEYSSLYYDENGNLTNEKYGGVVGGSTWTDIVITYKVATDTFVFGGNTAKHDWVENKELSVIPTACGEEGYVFYTCKNCAATYKEYVYKVHTIDFSYEFKNAAKPNCEEGGTLTMTCTDCGKVVYEGEFKSHKETLSPADLSEFTGVCDSHAGLLDAIKECECGEYADFPQYLFAWYSPSEFGLEWLDPVTWYCPKCGLTVTLEKSKDTKEGCFYKTEYTLTLKKDATTRTFVMLNKKTAHDYQEFVELVNKNGTCEDGVIITHKCVVCGDISYSGERSYYHTEGVIKVETLSDGSDTVTLIVYGCACGMAYDGHYGVRQNGESLPYNYVEVDDYEWHEYMLLNTRILIREEKTAPVNCKSDVNFIMRFGYDVKTGAYTLEKTYYITTVDNHKRVNVHELAEGSTNCNDGAWSITKCAVCGKELDRYKIRWHETYLIETIDCAAYGDTCGSVIYHYACACGEVDRFDFNRRGDFETKDIGWFYNSVGRDYSQFVYSCAVNETSNGAEVCGFRYAVKYKEVQDGNVCRLKTICYYILGCDENGNETAHSRTLDWYVADEYTIHEYEYTYGDEASVAAVPCMKRREVTRYCPKCGETYTYDDTYMNHTWAEEDYNEPLSKGRTLHVSAGDWCEACGYKKHIQILGSNGEILNEYTVQENCYGTSYERYFHYCGYYYELYYYNYNEGIERNSYYTFLGMLDEDMMERIIASADWEESYHVLLDEMNDDISGMINNMVSKLENNTFAESADILLKDFSSLLSSFLDFRDYQGYMEKYSDLWEEHDTLELFVPDEEMVAKYGEYKLCAMNLLYLAMLDYLGVEEYTNANFYSILECDVKTVIITLFQDYLRQIARGEYGCYHVTTETSSRGLVIMDIRNVCYVTSCNYMDIAPTCTQYGIGGTVERCIYCGKVFNVDFDGWVIEPNKHNFVEKEDGTGYYCSVCGIENSTNVNGSITLEDCTIYDDDYEDTLYKVGYYNPTSKDFDLYILLVNKVDHSNAEVVEDVPMSVTGIGYNGKPIYRYTEDGHYIRFSRKEVLKLAAEQYPELDLSAYDIRLTFAPVTAIDGEYDYGITFDR